MPLAFSSFLLFFPSSFPFLLLLLPFFLACFLLPHSFFPFFLILPCMPFSLFFLSLLSVSQTASSSSFSSSFTTAMSIVRCFPSFYSLSFPVFFLFSYFLRISSFVLTHPVGLLLGLRLWWLSALPRSLSLYSSTGCCPAIRCPIVVPFRPLFGGSLSSPSGHSDHCSAILDAAVAPRPLFGRRGHLRPLLSSLSGNLHSDAVRPLRPLLGRSSVSVGVWSSVYFSISVALLVLMSTTLRSRTFCSFVRPIPVSLCLSPSLCDWPPLFGRISHRDCLFFVIVSVVARSGAIQPLQLLFGRSPVGAFPASPPSLSILVLSTALPLLSGDTGFPIVPVRCLCAFCPAMLPHGRHC